MVLHTKSHRLHIVTSTLFDLPTLTFNFWILFIPKNRVDTGGYLLVTSIMVILKKFSPDWMTLTKDTSFLKNLVRLPGEGILKCYFHLKHSPTSTLTFGNNTQTLTLSLCHNIYSLKTQHAGRNTHIPFLNYIPNIDSKLIWLYSLSFKPTWTLPFKTLHRPWSQPRQPPLIVLGSTILPFGILWVCTESVLTTKDLQVIFP